MVKKLLIRPCFWGSALLFFGGGRLISQELNFHGPMDLRFYDFFREVVSKRILVFSNPLGKMKSNLTCRYFSDQLGKGWGKDASIFWVCPNYCSGDHQDDITCLGPEIPAP